ncbi:hypothetical protein D0859_11469 [Hortaea werneckii]|uniref:Citrate transporter-like domain-containing protein n=1 Tax=Hortaea werneckii TaxID=91943 RepID=A0A3M7IG20_HORWE|nr:hypothetical protein D0859_11469 [Hortaea werneckii]
MAGELDTSQIKDWRSIVTLIVFVITNIIVLVPFQLPIPIPKSWRGTLIRGARRLRITTEKSNQDALHRNDHRKLESSVLGISWVLVKFPMDFAPLIADLLLLAILAIGRQEVHDGTVGVDNIHPIDIMVFFLSLAYIAISIDASGLIRYLAFRVLKAGGRHGRLLYFYLYTFFFVLTGCIGNDPVILSGTAFLAYMTRVSSNIERPRAWIYMQFATANIGSAILVSSNPTNLVLAGAFDIKFIHYTANVIVPVLITAIVLFPFLLWIRFNDEALIPRQIKMHELPDEVLDEDPINPNIPDSRGDTHERQLQEILNPFLDKVGAVAGSVIMAATLITILAINAASQRGSETPVFYITLPAAFVMLCWDVGYGWWFRDKTRPIARRARLIERAKQEERRKVNAEHAAIEKADGRFDLASMSPTTNVAGTSATPDEVTDIPNAKAPAHDEVQTAGPEPATSEPQRQAHLSDREIDDNRAEHGKRLLERDHEKISLQLLLEDAAWWLRETFPTVAAVLNHLPWKLVPFAFCMFVLVQALVTKGWVPVFAHGWDHWIEATGVFAGTNIGTTILLSRVVQEWVSIHRSNGIAIPQRTFWATVYSMAIGVNYGAFSTAFSASLAGLLWRDILQRKEIPVRSLDFAWVNLPIIAVTMVVGCTVLIGEVYLTRDTTPYTG